MAKRFKDYLQELKDAEFEAKQELGDVNTSDHEETRAQEINSEESE